LIPWWKGAEGARDAGKAGLRGPGLPGTRGPGLPVTKLITACSSGPGARECPAQTLTRLARKNVPDPQGSRLGSRGLRVVLNGPRAPSPQRGLRHSSPCGP
jgi:hypothetical protein